MEGQALDDLVNFFAISVEPNANEVQGVGGNHEERGTVVDVVVGPEQRPSINEGFRPRSVARRSVLVRSAAEAEKTRIGCRTSRP